MNFQISVKMTLDFENEILTLLATLYGDLC